MHIDIHMTTIIAYVMCDVKIDIYSPRETPHPPLHIACIVRVEEGNCLKRLISESLIYIFFTLAWYCISLVSMAEDIGF